MARKEEIEKERLLKLEKLRKLKINPYPDKFDKKNSALELQEKYKKLGKDKSKKDKVKIAGRILVVRDIGKIIFATMQDFSGKIQIMLQKDKTSSKTINFFKKFVDSGDFVGVSGTIYRTKTGELSIVVKKLELLSKAILPLPEKWHGLQDEEERYRKRYLELIMNPELKEIFIKKQKFWKAIRDFLTERGFVEVETPVLENTTGGADAKPFITH